jgi:predicted ester cyclase
MDRQALDSQVRRLHGIWDTGDIASIAQVHAAGFVALMTKGWERSAFHGHSGARDAILRIRSALPDWHEEIQDLLIDGSRAVTRHVSTGTQSGLFFGLPPSGRAAVIAEMSIYRSDAPPISEQWCLSDDLTLARQLCLLPPAPAT